ncbi:hypothetical protein TNCV_246271 [Trichonephila clavipes]|nr:hypothetical protein TNCV_246271 [Trichonephila clavipes]
MKLAVTGPHFFLAHEFIQERVTGLNASREAHETYVDIEPVCISFLILLEYIFCFLSVNLPRQGALHSLRSAHFFERRRLSLEMRKATHSLTNHDISLPTMKPTHLKSGRQAPFMETSAKNGFRKDRNPRGLIRGLKGRCR